MKNKCKKLLYDFVKIDGITALIALAIIIIVSIVQQGTNVFDWSVFSSVVAVLLLHIISKAIQKPLMRRLEDAAKLTDDYEQLCSKYMDKMIIFDNLESPDQDTLRALKKLRKEPGERIQLPVICDYKLCQGKIIVQDSKTEYQMPDIIRAHFDELLEAHSSSQVYNQLNIRMDRWYYENGMFIIQTSRTTYFNSLATNRVMDFRWSNGMTVRELFEYGPYLHSLEESKLSNHIGFNGFVESSDRNIVFVKRSNHLSVGKGTYGNSVGASLKAKYALDASGQFSEQGLLHGILCEIMDELKIPIDCVENFSTHNIIAAYRDIVEGGKPQLLFYTRTTWTKEQIEQHFLSERKKSKKVRKSALLEDGDELVWIPRFDFGSIYFLTDQIIYKGKSYRMVPSAIASTIMLVQFLKEEGFIS